MNNYPSNMFKEYYTDAVYITWIDTANNKKNLCKNIIALIAENINYALK